MRSIMDLMTTKGMFQLATWILGTGVVALAFLVWGSNIGWRFDNLTTYDIFPLFGLSAFSLMWSQFVAGAMRSSLQLPAGTLKTYFSVSSYLVLLLILLHPGLYWLQLYLDGQGIPPFSYLSQFPIELHFALYFGTFSWFVFLLFETRKWFRKKSWWKFIEYLNVLAMFAIFFHALTLGGELMVDWYRTLWWFYGVSLALAVLYRYRRMLNNSTN